MSDHKPKLSFIPRQARIRCEFDRQYCIENPEGHDEIVERAKQRMRIEKNESRIAFYRIFATRLRTMWKMMIESTESPLSTVAVTIASGAPELPGLSIDVQAGNPKVLGYLSISAAPEVVQSWQSYFVKLTVGRALRDAGIESIANPAQIHRLWLHAAAGHPVVRVPIQPVPELANCLTESPYKLIEDTSHQDLSLVICDVNRMVEKSHLDDMTRRLSNFRDRMNSKGFNYEIQFEDVIRSIRSASRGPERYGLDLPLVTLAAYDKNRIQVSASASDHAEHSVRRQPSAPLTVKRAASKGESSLQKAGVTSQPKVKIEISSDNALARIMSFDPTWYSKYPDSTKVDAIVTEAQRIGVVHGITTDIRQKLSEAIKSKLNLTGFVVAEASAMIAGADPYLHRSFENSENDAATDEVVSIRERQRHGFVKRGQTICEIRFKTPAVDGVNIRGERIIAPLPLLDNISSGEGVSAVGSRFVAQFDGTPTVTESSITLTKGLVHKGNVDLTSGNIHFNGDVTITGNVDPGSTVEVIGNLIVEGSIQGGEIRVEGNLTVEGGISGCQGRGLFVTGDIAASFFENSRVHARGNIAVQKSILTSEVHAGGQIEVSGKDGLILGSQIYSEVGIKTENFGRPNAAITEAFLGCSHRDEKSYQIKLQRHKKLNDVKLQSEMKFKELHARPDPQKTDRHRQEESDLAAYVKRLDSILIVSQDRLAQAKERVRPNKEAFAEIRETLSAGSKFIIAGKKHTVRDAVAGVRIHLKSGSIKVDALEEQSKAEGEKKAS
jgi:uncharacterized protein (DUF342 family)